MPFDPDATLDPDAPAADGPPGLPGRLGPYRLEGLLGRGGMGEVYRGWDEGLQRPVAIKRVAALQRGRAEARARFWREARALAALDHPGVVRIHRVDETDDGELYLVMELVEGEPLSALMARPWPAPFVAAVGRQAAAALAAVQAAGMTHRDVKPANLIVQPDGVVRVVDFGLARRPEAQEDRVTATGTRVGTPAYMAPEQVEGGAVGPPADVFSLGVVLYRLVAGTHPFARDSAQATALALASGAHPPLATVAPEVDPALVAVVTRCLARDPAARYPDAAALATALAAAPAVDAAALAEFVADQERAAEVLSTSHPMASVDRVEPAPTASWRYLVGAAVILLALAWGWWGGARPQPPPAAPPVAGGAPAPPLAQLPPRPVVAVTGFAAPEDDPQDPRAAVLADALRQALAEAPEALVSVPLGALEGAVAPDNPVGPDLDPATLVRPGRRLGNVDLVVRGSLREEDARLHIEVEVVDAATAEVIRSFSVQAPGDPIEAAGLVARGLAALFGATLPDRLASPTPSANAYGAVLAHRAALRAGDFEAARTNLEWALQLDPRFSLARLHELAWLRAHRRTEDIRRTAEALLAHEDLSARDRLMAQAWLARGQEDGAAALRHLDALLDQWPYDMDAYALQMALRSNDPTVRDIVELEKVTRRVLSIAPRHEGAASRLIRSLAYRQRIDEAERLLDGFGVPREDPGFAEVWGELFLYAGRHDEAQEAFAEALRRSPGNLYAEHMSMANALLAGRCDQAAVEALNRIQKVEALGKDRNLDWTYSLACQALICRQQWPAARRLMDQWAARSSSGRDQTASLRPRVNLAAGARPAHVAKEVREALGGARDAAMPQLLRTLARVATGPTELDERATEAEAITLDPATPPTLRADWLRAVKTLRLRAALLRGDDLEGTLAGYADLLLDWSQVNDEGDLGRQVEALALHAEALTWAKRPDEAAAIWAKVRALGYPRLYVTDLWVLAGRAEAD